MDLTKGRREKRVLWEKRQSQLKIVTTFNPLGVLPRPPPRTPAPFAFSWDFGRSHGRNEIQDPEMTAARGTGCGEVCTHLQITQPNKLLRALTPRFILSMNQ